MAKTLHRTHEYHFGGRQTFRKVSVTTDSPERFEGDEREEFPFCVHGHAIRKPEEYGGQCICGRDVCQACAQNRCEIDSHILCRECTVLVRGKSICRTHGFWRMFVRGLGFE